MKNRKKTLALGGVISLLSLPSSLAIGMTIDKASKSENQNYIVYNDKVYDSYDQIFEDLFLNDSLRISKNQYFSKNDDPTSDQESGIYNNNKMLPIDYNRVRKAFLRNNSSLTMDYNDAANSLWNISNTKNFFSDGFGGLFSTEGKAKSSMKRNMFAGGIATIPLVDYELLENQDGTASYNIKNKSQVNLLNVDDFKLLKNFINTNFDKIVENQVAKSDEDKGFYVEFGLPEGKEASNYGDDNGHWTYDDFFPSWSSSSEFNRDEISKVLLPREYTHEQIYINQRRANVDDKSYIIGLDEDMAGVNDESTILFDYNLNFYRPDQGKSTYSFKIGELGYWNRETLKIEDAIKANPISPDLSFSKYKNYWSRNNPMDPWDFYEQKGLRRVWGKVDEILSPLLYDHDPERIRKYDVRDSRWDEFFNEREYYPNDLYMSNFLGIDYYEKDYSKLLNRSLTIDELTKLVNLDSQLYSSTKYGTTEHMPESEYFIYSLPVRSSPNYVYDGADVQKYISSTKTKYLNKIQDYANHFQSRLQNFSISKNKNIARGLLLNKNNLSNKVYEQLNRPIQAAKTKINLKYFPNLIDGYTYNNRDRSVQYFSGLEYIDTIDPMRVFKGGFYTTFRVYDRPQIRWKWTAGIAPNNNLKFEQFYSNNTKKLIDFSQQNTDIIVKKQNPLPFVIKYKGKDIFDGKLKISPTGAIVIDSLEVPQSFSVQNILDSAVKKFVKNHKTGRDLHSIGVEFDKVVRELSTISGSTFIDEFGMSHNEGYILLLALIKMQLNVYMKMENKAKPIKSMFKKYEPFFRQTNKLEKISIGYAVKDLLANAYNVISHAPNRMVPQVAANFLNKLNDFENIVDFGEDGLDRKYYPIQNIWMLNYKAYENDFKIFDTQDDAQDFIDKINVYPDLQVTMYDLNGNIININGYQGDDIDVLRFIAKSRLTPRVSQTKMYYKLPDINSWELISTKKIDAYKMEIKINGEWKILYFTTYEKLRNYLLDHVKSMSSES